MKNHAFLYKSTLLNNIIPFWEQHSIDSENGGYFTCLDQQGEVLIQINLCGFREDKLGYFLCFIIK